MKALKNAVSAAFDSFLDISSGFVLVEMLAYVMLFFVGVSYLASSSGLWGASTFHTLCGQVLESAARWLR